MRPENARREGRFVLGLPMMTGGGVAVKARGHPPIFCENRFPPRPLTRRSAALRGPDNHAATRLSLAVLNHEDQQQEALMGIISHIATTATDTYAALVSGLEVEFGTTETPALASYYIDAEAADFYWDARQMERHLGAYESLDSDNEGLELIHIIGVLNARWFVATCVVDGDGQVRDMMKLRLFTSAWDADEAFWRNG